MSSPEFRFRIPARCPSCQKSGNISLESTIHGATAMLEWCCKACSYSWPVTAEERGLPERRRTGDRDRRAATRAERRKRD